jgi:hypothetical protein
MNRYARMLGAVVAVSLVSSMLASASCGRRTHAAPSYLEPCRRSPGPEKNGAVIVLVAVSITDRSPPAMFVT